jgi:hypothetical protein
MTLKHKIEILNLLLTKSCGHKQSLEKQNSSKEQQQLLKQLSLSANTDQDKAETLQSIELDFNQIELYIIDLKKHIAQTITSWNNKMVDFFKKTKHEDVIYFSFTFGFLKSVSLLIV